MSNLTAKWKQLSGAIQCYMLTAEAEGNKARLEAARQTLDVAMAEYLSEMISPTINVSYGYDPKCVPCPACGAAHNALGYLTGTQLYCHDCTAWLIVRHNPNGTTSLIILN